jgi:hypothetical protein
MSTQRKTRTKNEKGTARGGSDVAVDPTADITAVVAKYTEFGWQAIRAPRGGMNDIVASKGTRFHFVQIVTKETLEDPKFHGNPKNNFIQNAFSNGAAPIYAHVVKSSCKNVDGTRGQRVKITFEDVNLGGRVIIGGNRRAEDVGDKNDKGDKSEKSEKK